MWRNRKDFVRAISLALTFLLALSLHWVVCESVRETMMMYKRQWLSLLTYPALVAAALWLSKSLGGRIGQGGGFNSSVI